MADDSQAGDGGERKPDTPADIGSEQVKKSELKEVVKQFPLVQAGVDANTAEIEKLKTKNELGMKRLAQWLSIYVFTLYFGAAVYFEAVGRHLELPELLNQVIWIFMIAPWCGPGLQKFINILSNHFGDKK